MPDDTDLLSEIQCTDPTILTSTTSGPQPQALPLLGVLALEVVDWLQVSPIFISPIIPSNFTTIAQPDLRNVMIRHKKQSRFGSHLFEGFDYSTLVNGTSRYEGK